MSALYPRSLDSSGTIRAIGECVLLLVILLLWPAGAHAQHIARDDTHVENASTSNFGNADRLRVGDGGRYTGFVRFDLSMLPVGVTGDAIQKATLRLFVSEVARGGSFEVSRVHGAWNETTLSFDTAAGIVGNVEAIVPVQAEDLNEYLLVDLTALVKEWVDGTQPNNGVALVPTGNVYLQFDSKEAQGTSHDPRLEIVLSSTETANGGVTSVTADSPLVVATPTTTPHISLGIVPTALGGTGLNAPGAAGSFLRSDGSAWTTAPLSAADLPAGSAHYVRNDTSPQPGANFNISGTGTANILNAATQFNLGGTRILSNAGTFNVFVGVGTGLSNTTGFNNAFVGHNAGSNNTTAAHNAFFGRNAGFSNTTGGSNAFFGFSAGFNNTIGFGNSFFGTLAGLNNTTGGGNSFFGSNAGANNTTGNNNAFFGTSAGSSNTTGGSNSFFGQSAGQANTTGFFNSFFGLSAGGSNTTGGSNSFFGRSAGQGNTTGFLNAFFGTFAGSDNTTGVANAFFGASAGSDNTTGRDNTFFGHSAGFSNTTGSANSFFGDGAGSNNTTGGSNTLIGRSAGFVTTNTTGTGNTLLGTSATLTADISNATAIGAFAQVTQSDSLVLGRVGASSPSVGIGTTAPKTKLHLVGGKLYVEANGEGVILKAPGGACFELTVSNAGALTTTPVVCP